MKKRVVILLAVLLLVFAVPVAAWADYIHGYFRYTIEDNSITITAYYGNETEVVVPAMIGKYPVNTIKAGVFTGTSVQKVWLPDTIMTIEEGAFAPGQATEYYSDEKEINKGGQTAPTGISDESGSLITTDSEGNLVMVDQQGTETVLDDTQSYTIVAGEEGQTVITGENGGTVTVDQSGTVAFTDAQDNKVTVSTTDGSRQTVSADNKTGSEDVEIGFESKDREQPTTYPSKSSQLKTILLIAGAVVVAAAIIFVFAKKGRNKA